MWHGLGPLGASSIYCHPESRAAGVMLHNPITCALHLGLGSSSFYIHLLLALLTALDAHLESCVLVVILFALPLGPRQPGRTLAIPGKQSGSDPATVLIRVLSLARQARDTRSSVLNGRG
jgi:hypothetical protein